MEQSVQPRCTVWCWWHPQDISSHPALMVAAAFMARWAHNARKHSFSSFPVCFCRREIGLIKGLSRPGWMGLWATLGLEWILGVHSNPSHSMIVWLYDCMILILWFYAESCSCRIFNLQDQDLGHFWLNLLLTFLSVFREKNNKDSHLIQQN